MIKYTDTKLHIDSININGYPEQIRFLVNRRNIFISDDKQKVAYIHLYMIYYVAHWAKGWYLPGDPQKTQNNFHPFGKHQNENNVVRPSLCESLLKIQVWMQVKLTLVNQSVAGIIFSKTMSPRSFSLSWNRIQSSVSLTEKKKKMPFEAVFTLWQAVQGDDILSYDDYY